MNRGKIIICMVFVFILGTGGDRSVRNQNSQVKKKCVTPNGEYGYCINIKRCPKLLSLLPNHRKNSSIYTFLINSKCGDENDFPRYPKVCCLSEDDIYETVSSIKLPSQDTCGRTYVAQQTILGGRKSELGEFPWMALLGYTTIGNPNVETKWFCGGSLISDRYVLTAFHCTVSYGIYKLAIVRLGVLKLSFSEEDEVQPTDVGIQRIISHTKYDYIKSTNDIALLKLKRRVEFNEYIQPICLPILSRHRSASLVKSKLSIAGWGVNIIGGAVMSEYLMKVEVPVVDNLECQKKMNITIDDTRLCAGTETRNGCYGDSGGPLMWPNGSQYYLMGVLNNASELCNILTIFTRVTSFLKWITDNMDNS